MPKLMATVLESILGKVDWIRRTNSYIENIQVDDTVVVKLEPVLKGVNLALKWGLYSIEIQTDSTTLLGLVGTKGAAKMLVKRRLGLLGELTG